MPAFCASVLRTHLPKGARAYVFGSRARGGARQYSDLDLALEWDRPLGLDLIGRIAEALSESDLPYKVDIVDLLTVDSVLQGSDNRGVRPFRTHGMKQSSCGVTDVGTAEFMT